MRLVGLVSSYKEGELIQLCVASLRAARLDALIVYEGPAGEPIEAEVPESNLEGIGHRTGRWRSDARKRNEMLKDAQAMFPGEPVWGIWLDGDEVLENGHYLRDTLQSRIWEDEREHRAWVGYVGPPVPEPMPTSHWPLWVVEAEGSLAVTTGRLVRLDLIRSYDISVSVVTNIFGIEEGFGNVQEDARLWTELWMRAVERGHLIAWPPKPGEPVIVHRSHLRHPERRGNRMHRQEAEHLKQAGKL